MLIALTTGLFFALLAIASVADLRSGRIPNALTLPAIVIALGLRLGMGLDSVTAGLLGVGLMFAVGFAVLALGAFGGGDAKLLVAVGAFLGPQGAALALLVTALAGGVLALLIALRRRVLLVALHNTRNLVRHWLSGGRAGEPATLDSPGALTVPYGIAIAVGGLSAWLLNGLG